MRRRRPLAPQTVQAGAWAEIAGGKEKALPCETARVGGEAGLVSTPRAVPIAEAAVSGLLLDLRWKRILTVLDQQMKAATRNHGVVRRDARAALDQQGTREAPESNRARLSDPHAHSTMFRARTDSVLT